MNEEMFENEEMIMRGSKAKSVEELKMIAREYQVEITDEQAEKIFGFISQPESELTEEELDAIAGGGVVDKVKEWFGSLFGK